MSIIEELTPPCACTEEESSEREALVPHCACPRDEHDIVIHEGHCLLYKNEIIIFPHEPESCDCCACPLDQCRCNKAGRAAFDEWRNRRELGAMPAVLESTHPLMQRFQDTLKRFLEKENAIAEEEILNLRDELKLSKQAYDNDLEAIYRSDHDTNAQRVLIEEYEATLAKRTSEREAAEQRARESNERYKKAKEKLEQDIINGDHQIVNLSPAAL